VAPPIDAEIESAEPAARLLTVGRAAMLSVGVLALLAARRRRQLRRARPRARLPEPDSRITVMERTLRSIDSGERFLRVDLAVRSSTMAFVAAGRRVVAVTAGDDGTVEVHASGPAQLDPPWLPTDEPTRWQVPGTVPIELLAEPERRVGAPCPALVQLGRTLDDRDLYVDLEALEAIEVGGPGHEADAIVTALAATLAGSVLAEVSTLVGVGIDDAAFLGHRHHVLARDAPSAFAVAAEAVGSTATSDRSTFELRARATGGETWEPAVVLVGAAAGSVAPPSDRTGLAVVSASPILGPSSRLAPEDGAWTLRPLGLHCVPVGLDADELVSLAALVGSADADLIDEPPSRLPSEPPARLVGTAAHADLTLAPIPDDPVHELGTDDVVTVEADPTSPPPILVRLLGPVAIRSDDGREATFEKSKAKELIAWLATHRERATRSGARTALWELDVRDATFANVVSEARRALARLVEPPEGEEWIGRTLTEALPLHDRVRTDADLVDDALAAARLQPPEQAIATLRPAVDLIVGVPFESTGYLWPEAEGIASRLVLLATSATAELAAHCLSMGDIDGVFDATARGLQVLPGHEELIGLRMRAHARAGDHAGVRQEWEQYERVVNADPWSDGEPSPTLVQLRRELLTR
jgi:DNA-binding SARP family transcriptional activator